MPRSYQIHIPLISLLIIFLYLSVITSGVSKAVDHLTSPDVNKRAGAISITADQSTGKVTRDLRLAVFTLPQGGYTLTASPSTVSPGGQLTVSWTAPSGRPSNDWVALYRVGEPNSSYLWWQYTNGTTSGSFNLSAPSQTGQYEFRYLLNNGLQTPRGAIL